MDARGGTAVVITGAWAAAAQYGQAALRPCWGLEDWPWGEAADVRSMVMVERDGEPPKTAGAPQTGDMSPAAAIAVRIRRD